MGSIEEQISLVEKTPGVCGGRARIRGTNIPVWLVIGLIAEGWSDDNIFDATGGTVTADVLVACQKYQLAHVKEISDDLENKEQATAECSSEHSLRLW